MSAMEIKILVKENQKKDLERFIETCKQHGFTVTREGGGKIPNWSGWFADLKGERWQNIDTCEGQSNIPDVINRRELLLAYHEFYLKWRSTVSNSSAEYSVDTFLSKQ